MHGVFFVIIVVVPISLLIAIILPISYVEPGSPTISNIVTIIIAILVMVTVISSGSGTA
jgi:hypothetical protein